MSYRVEYGCRRSFPEKKRGRGSFYTMTLLSAVLFLAAAYRLWPEGAAVMDRLWSFEGWALMRSALDTMALQLQGGMSIGEAVTAFCREIVNYGLTYAA